MSRQTETHHFFWKSKLSQWSTSPFTDDKFMSEYLPFNKVAFVCAEQYMMFHKAMIMGDFDTAKKILETTDPKEQQSLGRQVSGYDEVLWDRTRYDVVKRGNILKFRQNPELKKMLFDTYPRQLVEASPHDKIWGVGLDETDPMINDPENWRGRNLLGKVLTEVRDILMNEDGLL